jgi:hypothetical protein
VVIILAEAVEAADADIRHSELVQSAAKPPDRPVAAGGLVAQLVDLPAAEALLPAILGR